MTAVGTQSPETDVCGGDRDRPRGGGNRGGDAAAVGGVCDRRGGGGGDVGGVGRCVTVVGELTDGGEVDATRGTVAMVDRGETRPAGVGVETAAGRAGVSQSSGRGTDGRWRGGRHGGDGRGGGPWETRPTGEKVNSAEP